MTFIKALAIVLDQFLIREVNLAHHHALVILIQHTPQLANDVVHARQVSCIDVQQAATGVDAVPIRVRRFVSELVIF